MYIFAGIQYPRLPPSPATSYAALRNEAREGFASPEDTANQITLDRIAIMSVMHLWDGDVPAPIEKLIVGLEPTPLSQELRRRFVQESGYSRFASSTVHYAARLACACFCDTYPNRLTSSENHSVAEYVGKAKARALQATLRCTSCNNLGGGRLVFMDVARRPLAEEDHTTVAHRICHTCIDAYYVYGDNENRYFLQEDAGSVWAIVSEYGICSIEYARSSNFYYDTNTERWYRRRPRPEEIRSYDANPFDTFAWDTRNRENALVFGVELEMEPANDHSQHELAAALVAGGTDNFILKRDGSLDEGVELVTMPFTLEQHKEEKAIEWRRILESVKNIGQAGDGTTSCGMHVHINKKALSPLTIGKMLVFLNSDNLASLVTAIAQRSSGGFCSRDKNKKIKDGARNSGNRYDIMNVSVRHPTCEVRMFRGNLCVERVYKNLEFCHALVQYCRQASMRNLDDWGNFSRWLVAKRGTYPHLVQFLIDKNIVGFRHLARASHDGKKPLSDI